MFLLSRKCYLKTCNSLKKNTYFSSQKEMHYQVGHWFTVHLFMVSHIHKPILFSIIPCTTSCQFLFFCDAWLTDAGLMQHTVSCFGTGMLQFFFFFLQRQIILSIHYIILFSLCSNCWHIFPP